MRTNSDFLLREIGGEAVLVPTGKAAREFNGMISLTETAQFMWKHYDSCGSLEELLEEIHKEYDVDDETARRDVYGFTSAAYQAGLVMDVPELEEKSHG